MLWILKSICFCGEIKDTSMEKKSFSAVGNILLWRFDHEIFSRIILSLPLIQEGQVLVSGERMCIILVNPKACHVKV